MDDQKKAWVSPKLESLPVEETLSGALPFSVETKNAVTGEPVHYYRS